jgi:uncharacterized protein
MAKYPARAAIEAYGNGGFRFAGMSHRGSILCLADAIIAWDAVDAEGLTVDRFGDVLRQADRLRIVLLGTGRRQVFPRRDVMDAFSAANMGLEAMDTGAACRTYNILLAEQRPVAAALIAVD